MRAAGEERRRLESLPPDHPDRIEDDRKRLAGEKACLDSLHQRAKEGSLMGGHACIRALAPHLKRELRANRLMRIRFRRGGTVAAPRRTGTRTRGAGRPGARRVTSTRAGPSDDSDPADPEPPRGRPARRTSPGLGIRGRR
jgi:hypothetical protein